MRNELNNSKNLKDKSSICNHHLVDAVVYVQNINERIGLVINLLLEGYYMDNCSAHQIADHMSMNPIIYIENGIIYPCGGPMEYSKKFEPKLQGAIPHNEWIKKLRKHLSYKQVTEEDIKLFKENPAEFKKQYLDKYEAKYGFRPHESYAKPLINCGTNTEMFEFVTLLRDDDFIIDAKQRKKLGIYDWKRIFVHNHFRDEFFRFMNKEDYDPEKDHICTKPGYEDYYYRLATLEDILHVYKQGEINL